MKEQELINRIKKVEKVELSGSWIESTKKDIMGKEPMGVFDKVREVLSEPIQKPALVVSPLVLLAAILGGLFVYLNFIPKTSTPVFVVGENNEEVVSSLSMLQANLGNITENLENLKKVRDPKQALAISEIVKATAQEGITTSMV